MGKLVFLAIISCACANILNLDQLNAEIDKGPLKRVAFLTKANYDSVHTVLSDKAEVIICDGTNSIYKGCDTTAEMIQLIIDGSILAGLISGLPEAQYAPKLNTFTSTVISLRAMFMAPPQSEEMPHGTLSGASSSYDMSLAVDAAIVTMQSTGTDEQVRLANMPFEFMAVHTCRTDTPSLFTVPNKAAAKGLLKQTLTNKILKVGALGPYDWGGNDGNYKLSPPKGFYPDWLTEFCKHFNALKGPDGNRYDSAGTIKCERTYQLSSGKVFDDLFTGTTYVTEPYYVVDGWYTGTDSTFMTKKASESKSGKGNTVVTDAGSVDQLNDILKSSKNKKVAFLSQANYDAVQTVLNNDVQVVVCDAKNKDCDSTSSMIRHILKGDYVAGLISGLPEVQYTPYLNTFSSTVISLRAMFMSPPYSVEMPHGTTAQQQSLSSEDLSKAVDAAIVRIQASGKDEVVKKNNQPFEFMAVHTCKADDPSKFVVPNKSAATGLLKTTLDNKVLKVGALGPYDWGGNDGNYKVNPPKGFYPDWLTTFCEEFNNLAGPDGVKYNAKGAISCTRVYQKGSAGVFKDLFNGASYVTEPYYTVDSMYYGTSEACNVSTQATDCRVANSDTGYETCTSNKCTFPASPRIRHFRFSCSTLGIDSSFMIAKNFTISGWNPTTTTTTTIITTSNKITGGTTGKKITGGFKMSMKSTAIITNTTFVASVEAAIASHLNGVAASQVKATLKASGGRLLTTFTEERRLETAIDVAYVINLPASSYSQKQMTDFHNTMKAVTKEQITTSVNTAVKSAGFTDTITVTSTTPPTFQDIVTTTQEQETSAAGPGAVSQSFFSAMAILWACYGI